MTFRNPSVTVDRPCRRAPRLHRVSTGEAGAVARARADVSPASVDVLSGEELEVF